MHRSGIHVTFTLFLSCLAIAAALSSRSALRSFTVKSVRCGAAEVQRVQAKAFTVLATCQDKTYNTICTVGVCKTVLDELMDLYNQCEDSLTATTKALVTPYRNAVDTLCMKEPPDAEENSILRDLGRTITATRPQDAMATPPEPRASDPLSTRTRIDDRFAADKDDDETTEESSEDTDPASRAIAQKLEREILAALKDIPEPGDLFGRRAVRAAVVRGALVGERDS